MNIEDLFLKQNIILLLTGEQLAAFANEILIGARAIYEKKEPEEQYLTRKEVSKILNIDPSSLWRWDKQKYLCPVSVGGKRFYRLSDVNKILGKKTTV